MAESFGSESRRLGSVRRNLWVCVALCIVARVLWLWWIDLPLFPDEAQYWDWSRAMDWGYYSKPPMIAWLIAISTGLFGDSEPIVRLFSPVLHGLTAIVLGLFASSFLGPRGPRVAPWVSLAYLTLPAVSVSSWLISTDVPLVLCWTLATWSFDWAWRQPRALGRWLAYGLCVGAGMLSKYSMGLLVVSHGVLWLLRGPRSWRPWLGYVLAGLVACACYSPNLWWNLTHRMASYEHTFEISQIAGSWGHGLHGLIFVLSQALMVGPWMFVWWLRGLGWPRVGSVRPWILWASVVPPWTSMVILSLVSDAKMNWAAPVYGVGMVWLAWCVVEGHAVGSERLRRYTRWSAGMVALVLGVYIVMAPMLRAWQLPEGGSWWRRDPLSRMVGVHELAPQLRRFLRHYPEAGLLCSERKLCAWLRYYARPWSDRLRVLRVTPLIRNHYDMVHGIMPDMPLPPGSFYVGDNPELLSHWPYVQASEVARLDSDAYRVLHRRWMVYEWSQVQP